MSLSTKDIICKAGLWDIRPSAPCPVCSALPDTDCAAARLPGIEHFPKLASLLEFLLRLEPGAVQTTSDLRDDLTADSLDLIEITMEVEDAFGVVLQDDECVTVATVADLLGLIADKRRAVA